MLRDRPFEYLYDLTKIKIEYCDLSQFDFDSLNSITTLETVDIETYRNKYNKQCSLKIDLNRLVNLKWLELSLFKENKFELITNVSNQLNTLKVSHTTIDFSNPLDFPQLKCLDMFDVDLSQQISQKWLNGLKSLTKLYLNYTNLEDIGFMDAERLENLEMLDLSFNRITVSEKEVLSKFKKLKSVNLRNNNV